MSVKRRVVGGALVLALAVSVALGGCVSDKQSSSAAQHQENTLPVVSTSAYPTTWLTSRVGEGVVHASSLLPDTADPHERSFDAKSLASLREGAAIVYLGSGFQPELEKAITTLPASVRRVDLLTAKDLTLRAVGETEEEHEAHGDHEHDAPGAVDVHFWLDPLRMKLVAKQLSSELQGWFPDQSSRIQENEAKLSAELDALDADIQKRTTTCTNKHLVTSHAAFGYFAERYGFAVHSVSGLSTSTEPSAKSLQALSKTVKENGVETIYVEGTTSTRLSDTVAKETGAQTAQLLTLETTPRTALGENADYVSAMRANLDRITQGQGC